ncbi:MAG TPA: carboxymuconolactone decarboxylase family protein [Burkholderiales bacterium]|nr:carboxymuconolactone decarboxylase family protein [Burkholderiales bacterium]
MQRIKPKNPEGDAQLAATYGRITETRGYVSNILMSLSHAPAGLEAFAKYGEYVRYGTDLPGRVRELSVLAIAAGNQYAWSHHHPHAIKAGVMQPELDSLESGGALADTISAPEKAAIRYAREFGQGGKVSDDTFAEVKRHFSERQITDLTLLCGYFMALGSTITAFRVELEPNFAPKAKRA